MITDGNGNGCFYNACCFFYLPPLSRDQPCLPFLSHSHKPCCKPGLSRVQSLLCDSGYVGQLFAQGVQDILGGHVMVQIARRSKLHTFKVMPRRWIVERSFAWLDKNRRLWNRRLWKNCERLLNTRLQFVLLAFLALMIKKL